tara:strand:- start:830 stop:1123 length:294 start_codon:yes stop_codon:yes gene_type:complete
MIDTDKYEGHPPAPWGWRHKVAVYRLTANGDKEWIDIQVNEDTDPTVMALIADAPLLLEEVKRLNALIHRDYDWLKSNYPKVFDEMMMSKLYGDEEE